jgi:hypothetical protein
VDGHDEFAVGQSEMSLAVFHIELAQRNAAMALRADDVDFGAKNEQSGRKIATVGGVTALSLWGNMTNIPTILETICVGVPPPFALIVINAAGIDAQIAANRPHVAVTRPGDRLGGLRECAILGADHRVAGKSGDGHTRTDHYAAFVGLELG